MYIELKTERLLLRPTCADDLAATHVYAGDAELTRYMTYFPRETPEETLASLVSAEREWQKESPDFFEFTILLNDEQIGGVSLWLDETRTEGELGWILNRSHWGHGYAAEGAAALRDFAFHTLHLRRVTASCDTRNLNSVRVMKKLGMALISDNGIRQYKKRPEIARSLLYALDNPKP